MQRLLLIASMAGLLFTATGCLHRQVRNNHCHSCQQADCGPKPGLLGHLRGALHRGGPIPFGCEPGPLGWQQGGTNYPSHVNGHRWPGQGLGAGRGLGAGGGLGAGLHAGGAAQQAVPGPPTGTVGYPYYTTRGPRDFLLDNPPSIGR